MVVGLRLRGFDVTVVRTRDRYRFVPTEDQRLVVGSTTDDHWESDHPGNTQPWDLGEIHVRQAPGVLGIFDGWTVDDAGTVLDAASNGRSDVRAVVGPGTGSAAGNGVVVYSLQDPTFLDGLAGQTVGDPDRADGLTIAVPADAQAPGKGAASYRIFVNPRVLGEPASVVGRLVRHEPDPRPARRARPRCAAVAQRGPGGVRLGPADVPGAAPAARPRARGRRPRDGACRGRRSSPAPTPRPGTPCPGGRASTSPRPTASPPCWSCSTAWPGAPTRPRCSRRCWGSAAHRLRPAGRGADDDDVPRLNPARRVMSGGRVLGVLAADPQGAR
ncbi:hypothetical protein G5V59_05690 [Nocardioides sp. W3-2-3]|uniref:hypothetical protein n=1 Tax=Nocardioides convexus TaxID=2712224 RepID=UPI002418B677|nr:hypothetical protein [Nocardioides convexus]NGZ99918.1 hypothetical protein [Nocardioides convexus]